MIIPPALRGLLGIVFMAQYALMLLTKRAPLGKDDQAK